MTAEPYRDSIHIEAAPDLVFDYFTRPEALVRWMGDRAKTREQLADNPGLARPGQMRFPLGMGADAKTRVSHIALRDDGIIFVDCSEGVEFRVADAHETLAKIDELTGSRPAAHCVDLRKIKSMERACREIFANGRHTKAAALIVSNPLSRVIGNFFLGLSKTAFPLRLFSDTDGAITWLRALS